MNVILLKFGVKFEAFYAALPFRYPPLNPLRAFLSDRSGIIVQTGLKCKVFLRLSRNCEFLRVQKGFSLTTIGDLAKLPLALLPWGRMPRVEGGVLG
jgi:hypothetical protein